MAKYRSRKDYSAIYAGDKQGFNLGIDNALFLRTEVSRGTFSVPRIGTQGKSIGDTAASTDISAGTDKKFKIALDGGSAIDVELTLAGLTTGTAIAAEMETKINAAMLAAALDARVWVLFDGGDDHYEVYSQFTGLTSAVVITDATADNVADDLKIGVANGGTESVGTDDQDHLLHTTGGTTFSQPQIPSAHRTDRFHGRQIRQKKVAEFDIDTYINMSGDAGDSLDTSVRTLLRAAFGKETVVPATSIIYEQGQDKVYFSIVAVSTIFGEYYTGGYVRDFTLDAPGDAPGTYKFTGKAEKASIAGISQANGIVSASTDWIANDGESKRYTENARVMLVDIDGRSITDGADGSLYVASLDHATHKVVLSSAVTAADDSYLVPWHPGVVQQTGRDNPYTDLEGSVKLDESLSTIDTTNINLALVNDHVDLDGYFGRDANAGYVAGNRCTMTQTISFDLSNENFAEVVQTRAFEGFKPIATIGATSGRHLVITSNKWTPAVPPIERPENGTTPMTLEGILEQSAPGNRDPIKLEYK
jgi:hypothetical protein